MSQSSFGQHKLRKIELQNDKSLPQTPEVPNDSIILTPRRQVMMNESPESVDSSTDRLTAKSFSSVSNCGSQFSGRNRAS